MIEHFEVRCTPNPQRPFPVNRGSGYSNPDMRWRWCCPVCTFTCEDRLKETCQLLADTHASSCTAGWCPIPMTVDRMMFSVLPHVAEPTPADRERWNQLRIRNVQLSRARRERDAAAARTADRIVPMRRNDG